MMASPKSCSSRLPTSSRASARPSRQDRFSSDSLPKPTISSANANAKLTKKRLDLIVANDVGLPEVGFAHDTNAVTLLRPDAEPVEIDLAAKRDVARAVINTIVDIRAATQTGKD